MATILALLCTECPRRAVLYDGVKYHVATGPRGLPQGACTSPGLSNQVGTRLDRRLAGLAAKLELLTPAMPTTHLFGRGRAGGAGGLLAGEGPPHRRGRGVRRQRGQDPGPPPGTAQTVTGLVVNDRPGVRRAEVRRIRGDPPPGPARGTRNTEHRRTPQFRRLAPG